MQNLTDEEKKILQDALDFYIRFQQEFGHITSEELHKMSIARAKLILCFNPEKIEDYNNHIEYLDAFYADPFETENSIRDEK